MDRPGVRHRGILSTHLYKIYNNKLLEQLEREGDGLHIGTTFMGAPTCADDMLHLTTGDDRLQAMLANSDQFSDQQRYIIHPIKSESTSSGQPANVSLKDKQLPQVDSVKHLGLSRNPKSNSEAIEERLECGRRSLYSLIPAGLHGESGISPPVAKKLLHLYILPRMTYGRETLILLEKDLKTLDKSYIEMLRNMMALRNKTASAAVYLLKGSIPIRGEIHIQMLKLYGAITRMPQNSSLNKIAFRQLTVGHARKSWFIQIRKVAMLYNIETEVLSAVTQPLR